MRSQPRAQLGERLVKDIKVLGPIQSFGSFAIYLRTLLLKKRRGKRMKHTPTMRRPGVWISYGTGM